MSNLKQFSALVEQTQRSDGYINATKLCKTFNYRLDHWKELQTTKDRYTSLFNDKKISPWIVERVGKTWVTWVHPIMAVHLASYLDPDFANYTAEIFVGYLKADPHLAANIASRQETTEGLDIINKAVQERYKFIQGRDWNYSRSLSNVEIHYLHKKWRLPFKNFTPIAMYLDLFSDYDVMADFFNEKYPYIKQLMELQGTGVEDHAFLLGYFKEEIETWVKEKNLREDSF